MRPTIRDASGPPVFGVEPAKLLEKALRPWSLEELAEYKEFILINSELATRRIEKEVAEAGGHPVEPNGIDSQTYWLPESGLVGVFDLRREYEKALASSLQPGFHPIRRFFAKTEYRSNLWIGFSHDACRMRASARLVLLRRESGLPLNRLKKRADAIISEANWLSCKQTFLSMALPAIMLILFRDLLRYLVGGKPSDQPNESGIAASAQASKLTGLEESAYAAPPDLPPHNDSQDALPEHIEPKIKDDTGEKLYGLDAGRLLQRTLRLWKPKDYSCLTEIILVGNDLVAKQAENRLLQHGARPLYGMRPEGRAYALKREGAVQLINIAHIQNPILSGKAGRRFNSLFSPFAWFYYRARLQSAFASTLPYGLAYAQLAHIERDTKLSRKAASDMSSKLYWDLKFAMMKRFRYWTMVPAWLLLFALLWLRNGLRRTAAKDAKKSRT